MVASTRAARKKNFAEMLLVELGSVVAELAKEQNFVELGSVVAELVKEQLLEVVELVEHKLEAFYLVME